MLNTPSLSSSPQDLESRVASRKKVLISEIIEHKKNSSRAGAVEAIGRIKDRLSVLAHIEKGGVVGGWTNVDPSARLELEAWIAR
jgi:hypothetical protein